MNTSKKDSSAGPSASTGTDGTAAATGETAEQRRQRDEQQQMAEDNVRADYDRERGGQIGAEPDKYRRATPDADDSR